MTDPWSATGTVSNLTGRRVWHRLDGDSAGPATTFLHGYPTSSLDWQPLLDAMGPTDGRRRVVVDLLGYGASDRPRRVTFADQIDVLLALWRRYDVTHTVLVAHDYSVSIAQEILARVADGDWDGPVIQSVVLLNGGVTWSGNRPLLIQQVLRVAGLGAIVAAGATYPLFARNLGRITASPHDLRSHWDRLVAGEKRATAYLASYHDERRRHESRWVAALAHAPVPVRLVWGMADPIAAGQVPLLRQRAPSVAATLLPEAGHYPHWDDPRAVARVVADAEIIAGDRVPPLWPLPVPSRLHLAPS